MQQGILKLACIRLAFFQLNWSWLGFVSFFGTALTCWKNVETESHCFCSIKLSNRRGGFKTVKITAQYQKRLKEIELKAKNQV
jgi:hypothetical protein